MEYSSEVRRRFSSPARGGSLPAGEDVIEGTGEDRSLGFWVRFQVRLRGSSIGQVRFGMFGCPHAIAAADLLAERLEGQPVAALGRADLGEVARAVGLPREKFGKLLRIEDALRTCHRRAAGTTAEQSSGSG